jgi:biotin transporter BioY
MMKETREAWRDVAKILEREAGWDFGTPVPQTKGIPMTLRALGVILAGAVYGGATSAFVLTAFLSAGLPGGVAVAWAFGVGVIVGIVSGVVVSRA